MTKKLSAYEWGVKHKSCPEALELRKKYASQSDWYAACNRGDWLLWQLKKLHPSIRDAVQPALRRAVEVIVDRAVRRGIEALRGVGSPEAVVWRQWAKGWLDGTDRTPGSAWSSTWPDAVPAAMSAAVSAAVLSARYAAVSTAMTAAMFAARDVAMSDAMSDELRLQALDIRQEIPEWPEEKGGE